MRKEQAFFFYIFVVINFVYADIWEDTVDNENDIINYSGFGCFNDTYQHMFRQFAVTPIDFRCLLLLVPITKKNGKL